MKDKKTSYASPGAFYRDPSECVDNSKMWDQLGWYEKRAKFGCSKCVFQRAFGDVRYCDIGNTPKPYYCHSWQDADEVGDESIKNSRK